MNAASLRDRPVFAWLAEHAVCVFSQRLAGKAAGRFLTSGVVAGQQGRTPEFAERPWRLQRVSSHN
eukprot:13708241-Alexandrium_andersonii.AAC.1